MKNVFEKIKINDYTLGVIDKIFSILIGVVSSAFYIRYLGVEFKGTYSYINEIASIVAIVLNIGIYQSYPFYYRIHGNKIFRKYVDIYYLQFIVYFVLSVVLAVMFRNHKVAMMIIIQMPFMTLKSQYENIAIVEGVRTYMFTDMIYKSVLAIVYFILWLKFPTNLWYIIIPTQACNFLLCIGYSVLFKYKPSINIFKVDLSFLKELIVFGILPMLSNLLITLNYSVDIIFLKHLGDPTELSLYSVASVIMNYVWLIPNAFKEVLISKVARKDSQKSTDFSIKISLVFTAICWIGFAIIGKFALGLVFGKEFIPAYGVINILFIGAFSMIFYKMLGVVLLAEGKRLSYFLILLISVIMNVGINYLMIPVYGMNGAAWASVISYTICGILFLIYYCRIKNYPIKNMIWISKDEWISVFSAIKGIFKKSKNNL